MSRLAPQRYITFGTDRPLAQIETRAWHDWNAALRKQRKHNHRQAIIDRDGMVCGICGGPVESVSDIDIDHILPVALGGKSTPDNLRVSHSWCNRSRGARADV